jgi:hypothetical protein
LASPPRRSLLIAFVFGAEFPGQTGIVINQIVYRDAGLVGVGFYRQHVGFAHSPFEVQYLPTIYIVRKA